MNDEEARQGPSDAELLSLSLSGLPDPLLYRQKLPTAIRRAYEWGEIDRLEVWERLARLRGIEEVEALIRGRAA